MYCIGRRPRETYNDGARGVTFGVPDEIIRYYFAIDDTSTPGATFTSRPWNASEGTLVPTNPPSDFNFILPVPPCNLQKGALSIVTVTTGGAITGDPILIQWRGILGNNPVIAVPAPALGASQTFIDTAVIGALPSGTISILNFNFSDVVVPLGGATIFPDLAMPANLVVPEGSSLTCFFAQGILWNANLITQPQGPSP